MRNMYEVPPKGSAGNWSRIDQLPDNAAYVAVRGNDAAQRPKGKKWVVVLQVSAADVAFYLACRKGGGIIQMLNHPVMITPRRIFGVRVNEEDAIFAIIPTDEAASRPGFVPPTLCVFLVTTEDDVMFVDLPLY